LVQNILKFVLPYLAFGVFLVVNAIAKNDLSPFYVYGFIILILIIADITSKGNPARMLMLFSVLGIIALCVFAAQTAQEYTYGTLRNLLIRQPGRMKILVGKLISMILFGLVMISIAAVISIAISYILAPGAKVSTDLWFTSAGFEAIFTTFINVTISVVAFGIVGMVLGLLLRSPISAISFGVLWILIIEVLLMAVKNSLQSWLPGAQLSAIASGGSPDLTYTHALTVGGLYVAVGAIVASVLFVRRDVAN
jgi:ABC-type transport system involved in multi-copper enzyme maturation permease subunit